MEYQFAQKKHEALFQNYAEQLISIPSVREDSRATKGAPFGPEITKALIVFEAIATELGFKCYRDPEGYYAYAEIGSGEEMYGIVGHLDVVPAGDRAQWKSDPFELTVDDVYFVGRGIQDDKGPVIANLLAVKAVVDAGHVLHKRVRVIVGTDEENTWECMDMYRSKEELPTFGITPDADFPLIFAEKGIAQYTLEGEGTTEYTLYGGTAFNAVADQCTYEGNKAEELAELLSTMPIKSERLNETTVRVYGASAHGSTPQEGVNAIKYMVDAMVQLGIKDGMLEFLSEKIGMDVHALKLYGRIEDEVSGQLTMNVGKIEINSEHAVVSLDMRIPVTYDLEECIEKIASVGKSYGLTYVLYSKKEKLYVPKETPFIQTLLRVYNDVTGRNDAPLTSGGGTYARAFDNLVAFGSLFHDSEVTFHMPNERMKQSEILPQIEIYARAVYELCVSPQ